MSLKLSEELAWRDLINQTTYKDLSMLDGGPITFYWGVDPSADSMTVGNLAAAMLVKRFMQHGHKAVVLIGGATGMIGDPDGKASERQLLSKEELDVNKQKLAGQYRRLFGDHDIDIVDNYDWFKGMGYLDFLREVGKHVPTRQMLAREFVQARLSDENAGISYAEFSYMLIQAYDFLWLFQNKGVTLQVCGSDQWGNCIAGVDLIRRKTGGEAHVFSVPLVVNPATGQKFGKTEAGAVWLDAAKTSPTQFYQFWINADDAGVESYLKIFTELDKNTIENLMEAQRQEPGRREAQAYLAKAVTEIVHGRPEMQRAEAVTEFLTGRRRIGDADSDTLQAIQKEIPMAKTAQTGSIIEALVQTGLAGSNTEARRLIAENAVVINGQKVQREAFEPADFVNGRLLLRRGKAYKDSALVELQ